MNFFENIGEFVQNLIETIGYPGITFVMFLENVFPPIPSELILPFTGFLVGQGKMNFFLVWFASVLGSLLGALVLYGIGRWTGDHVIRQFLRRYGVWFTLSEKDYDRALHFFHHYGEAFVFFGRLVPIVRSIISIPAGADHMPLRKFFFYTTLGSSLWNGLLIGAGMILGDNWEQVIAFVERYQRLTILVIVIVAVVVVGRLVYQRWFRTARDVATPPAPNPVELPISEETV